MTIATMLPQFSATSATLSGQSSIEPQECFHCLQIKRIDTSGITRSGSWRSVSVYHPGRSRACGQYHVTGLSCSMASDRIHLGKLPSTAALPFFSNGPNAIFAGIKCFLTSEPVSSTSIKSSKNEKLNVLCSGHGPHSTTTSRGLRVRCANAHLRIIAASASEQATIEETEASCTLCNAKGWLLCEFCQGKKVNVQVKNNRMYRRCPSCKTAGFVLCPKCKVYKCVTFPDGKDGGFDM